MSNAAETRAFTPFDEQRHIGDLRRADIIFGPDMFDPRIVDGHTPLTDALHVALEEGELADLGLTKDDMGKTAGEVYGDISPRELTERCLEISRRLEPKPPMSLPPKGFLRRLLSFAR